MEASGLVELAKRYQDDKEFITNEEAAKMALIVPFIRLLGYDPNNPREVRLEYAAEFTQGDGKRLPDRMDFAIFDKTGQKPLMVIEAKPLGTDLRMKSPQLARYLAQMKDLRFGIITDGCHYQFFGDLESPNLMDQEPFFRFSLDDAKADWQKIAKFLTKFSRDSFNAETLITDAENSRYRQEITERLARALKAPGEDEEFLKWLTDGIYKGKRTAQVLTRLADVAKDSVEPALLKVMGDEFLEKLRSRIRLAQSIDNADLSDADNSPDGPTVEVKVEIPDSSKIVTSQEELDFFAQVKQICVQAGVPEADLLYKDTTGYFNVSYKKPTRWFIRYFGDAKRKNIVTLVPIDEARSMAADYEVEVPPPATGASRIYIESPAQVWALKSLVIRSLDLLKSESAKPVEASL